MSYSVLDATETLAKIARDAGLAAARKGSVPLFARGGEVVARWIEDDPAHALDVPVPAIVPMQWMADLLAAFDPDLRVFVVRPGSGRFAPSPEPRVVTLTPGVTELVEHGVNGLIIDPDDPRGAERLQELLERDRERLEAGAREKVAAWPSDADAAEALVAALDEIAALPPVTLPPNARPYVEVPSSHAHPVLERPRLRKLRERLG
jgi:hypothetical protein